MSTVTTYLSCPHCGALVALERSESKKLTNLLLCPLCNRNVFGIGKPIEEEE